MKFQQVMGPGNAEKLVLLNLVVWVTLMFLFAVWNWTHYFVKCLACAETFCGASGEESLCCLFFSKQKMAGDRLPSIEKLDGSNWSNWKVQLMNFLKAQKLWKLCLGTETPPQQASVNQTEEHEVKVAQVMLILCQTMSTQYLYLITSQTVATPKEAWDALVGQFECPWLSNKMSLMSQLFGLHKHPEHSLEEHLKVLTDLVEWLAALGSPVEEQDQVVLLLWSLPDEFEAMVVTYMAKGDMQMPELQEALLSYEAWHMVKIDGSGQSALWAGQSSSYSSRGNAGAHWGHGPRCYGCGKHGHLHRFCSTNLPRGGRSGSEQAKANHVGLVGEEYSMSWLWTNVCLMQPIS